MYELGYYQDEGLHTLEAFAEGTFNIGKLRVERKYLNSGGTPDEKDKGGSDGNYTFYTKVVNTEAESMTAQVGLLHGFSEDSDTWLETAY